MQDMAQHGSRRLVPGRAADGTPPPGVAAACACADQAATLRRLFARRPARVLPLLVPPHVAIARSAWIAKLAQSFAVQGQRTLVVDAARLQVAAALGLRARLDLAHAVDGECVPAAALLDAGQGLTVLPAARALAQAGSVAALGARIGRLDLGPIDLVLLIVPTARAHEIAGDALVPVLPQAADLQALLPVLRRVPGAVDGTRAVRPRQHAQTGCFRLLFLGLAEAAASTLMQRLMQELAMKQDSVVQSAGCVGVARDLMHVVRAAAGWTLTTLPQPPME